MVFERKSIVFVSCGQRTAGERRLGQNICDLIEELTPFKPYFAQNQSSVEGLTTNIFRALYDAAGLIAVLHQRGHVSFERDGKSTLTRASVFVEQEVALAAFITQVLMRPLQVAAFIARGIELEGVREHLILNPIEFETDDEILGHLRRILPAWTTPQAGAPLDAPVELRLELKARVAHRPGRSEDKLSVLIRNNGADELTKYRGEVLIPKGVVETPSNAALS